MIRTQVQLTEAQVRELRRVARAEGVSLAEVVRRCVDHRLGQVLPDRRDCYARAARLVGRFRDREGSRDLATEHDRYLDEVFG